ncbi:MAG: fibronectin/fibrinogen-binding protein [Eubacterium sp.]|jgi:predicted ribosome quality control (RQC) complex YloA/Tae2 family protein|nr:fibronectin/fibrinogen-binding protein [Eubacterium sp.]
MAFDGFTVAALTSELSEQLTGGRLQKIAQPESDELLLTIKKTGVTNKLVLSANPSLPLVYLTEKPKASPLTAPNFCMLLRKHLSGARITDISQYGLERVIRIEMENRNELGDEVTKCLIIEIMGKHSNIIFVDDTNKIIDSIKHVSSLVSSVREVLPGRDYFIPNTKQKHDPFAITTDAWMNEVVTQPSTVVQGLCRYFTGISLPAAHEIADRSRIDGDTPFASLNGNQRASLFESLKEMLEHTRAGKFAPEIVWDNDEPVEFSAFPLTMYEGLTHQAFPTMSETVENYYSEKEIIQRIRQKSMELRKHVTTLRERAQKKLSIQEKQLSDTKKRDKFKVYGELIHTYGYQLGAEDQVLICTNYYDGKEVRITIDPTLSPSENANHYFNRYNKLKRTFEAVTTQIAETKDLLEHLDTILTALDIARQEEDLVQIKQELIDNGFIKSRVSRRKNKQMTPKSNPLHYVSSDGYDIYVGKNNYQNDYLTFKFASGSDWWFHVKQAPGSHVVIKCNNEEPPITTFEEAASLAAFYSQKRNSPKVEIDYVQKKHVKRPNGGKSGFVVYYTNYSMVVSPDISHIKEIDTGGNR